MISLSDRPKLYVIDEVATDNIKIVDKEQPLDCSYQQC